MTDTQTDLTADSQNENPKPAASGWKRICIGFSCSLGVFLLTAYHFQWDRLTGLTNIPAFLWLIPASILLLLSRRSSFKRLWYVSWSVWAGYLLVCVPETTSMVRVLWNGLDVPARSDETDTIRVVTYNLGDHPAKAIEEILPYDPDIVLLQELSSEQISQEFGKRLYGENYSLVFHSGQAILARGKIISQIAPTKDRRFRNYVGCRIRLSSEKEITLACVHLAPPAVIFNFISPQYWNRQTAIRKMHRDELQEVLSRAQPDRQEVPFILGGDFNAPARDGCTNEIREFLTDCFAVAGVGWGNTGPSQFPLHRVDQIWATAEFQVEYCTAIATQHSDHRLVLCDLRIHD